MTTHILRLHNEPFNLIKIGKKTVEMRLYDEKRRNINVGDYITFINRKTEEELTCIVKNIKIFSSFEQLYKNYTNSEMGYAEDEFADPKDLEQYYSKEEQKKYNVCALEISKIEG